MLMHCTNSVSHQKFSSLTSSNILASAKSLVYNSSASLNSLLSFCFWLKKLNLTVKLLYRRLWSIRKIQSRSWLGLLKQFIAQVQVYIYVCAIIFIHAYIYIHKYIICVDKDMYILCIILPNRFQIHTEYVQSYSCIHMYAHMHIICVYIKKYIIYKFA